MACLVLMVVLLDHRTHPWAYRLVVGVEADYILLVALEMLLALGQTSSGERSSPLFSIKRSIELVTIKWILIRSGLWYCGVLVLEVDSNWKRPTYSSDAQGGL
jgi:hypothetical protein